jgi:hypothetical protein
MENRSMRQFSRTFLVLTVMSVCLVPSASAILVYETGGKWPNNWPSELEPLRKRAMTAHFRAGSQSTRYEIPFENRDEFERLWPILLRLKSKGAPLSLHSIDAPATGPNDNRARTTKPQVTLLCPPDASYTLDANGQYTISSPWVPDVISADGELPAYIAKRLNPLGNKWEAVDISNWNEQAIRDFGVAHKGRVEIVLHVDGNVIDLNRIRFPPDTPIHDNRAPMTRHD